MLFPLYLLLLCALPHVLAHGAISADSQAESNSLSNPLVRRNGAGAPFPKAPSRSNGEVLQIRIRKEKLEGRPLCGLEIETPDEAHIFLAAAPGDPKIQVLRRGAGTGHPTGIRSGVIYARDVDKAVAWAERWFVVPPYHGSNVFCWRVYDDLRSHLRHEKLLRFTKGGVAGIVLGSIFAGTGIAIGRKIVGTGLKVVGNGLKSCMIGTAACLDRTEARLRLAQEQREARARAEAGGAAHGFVPEGEVPAGRARAAAGLEAEMMNAARGRMAKARGDEGVGPSTRGPFRTTEELHQQYLRKQAGKGKGDSSYGSANSGESDFV